MTTTPVFNKAAIISRLHTLGWAVNPAVPGYALTDTLRRFQRAHFTPAGLPLEDDGKYGPQTEAALFTTYIPGRLTLIDIVLAVAVSQIGVCEVPPGSNRGPQIDIVLRSVGLGPGYPWCAAFLHWCFEQASRQLDIKNPSPESAGVLNLWALSGYPESGLIRVTAEQARKEPALVKPGMQFLLKLSPDSGHTGIILAIFPGGQLVTIEGNSNNTGSREGQAVTKLTRRTINSINLGFIQYPVFQ